MCGPENLAWWRAWSAKEAPAGQTCGWRRSKPMPTWRASSRPSPAGGKSTGSRVAFRVAPVELFARTGLNYLCHNSATTFIISTGVPLLIPDDYHLIVDVEATCSDDGVVSRDEMEIIEIGAVIQSSRS